MSFFDGILDVVGLGKGGFIDEALRGFDDKVLGGDSARAAMDAAEVQRQAGQEASALLNPFQQLGQSGLDQAGFLTDPNAQFQFLQSNPLFQMGLDNLNTQTQKNAAATGRLSATDTQQQFMNNSLLAASPLIQGQQNQISNLLNMGLGVAGNQGNLLTGQAAAQAGGIVGAANARQAGVGNLMQLGGMALAGSGLFAGGAGGAAGAAGAGAAGGGVAGLSDVTLKNNIEKIGTENGFHTYKWDWNELAMDKFGLSGSSSGVIAQEVAKVAPDAVSNTDGFMRVNYEMIGVSHND
jgi:hypothetical protein